MKITRKPFSFFCLILFFLFLDLNIISDCNAQQKLSSPKLSIWTLGLDVTASWTEVPNASSYTLYYAPYPYRGEKTIESIFMNKKRSLSVTLWDGATYYVAIVANSDVYQNSDFSNIVLFKVTADRDVNYCNFWLNIDSSFKVSQETIYAAIPNIKYCYPGALTNEAKMRALNVLNQVRKLHHLPLMTLNHAYDNEVQLAALVQAANNMLTHTPPPTAACYTQAGYNGSSTSNLYSGYSIIDPAQHIIGWLNDDDNVAVVQAVGHRRWLLNPFEKNFAYGQIEGYAVAKAFKFDQGTAAPSPDEIPDFVAFPYSRYPAVFISPKTYWSFSVIEDKTSIWGNHYDYFKDAQVFVINKATGAPVTVKNVYRDSIGYGVPNVITWQVEGVEKNTWYTVIIHNIDFQHKDNGDIVYDVFIDSNCSQ